MIRNICGLDVEYSPRGKCGAESVFVGGTSESLCCAGKLTVLCVPRNEPYYSKGTPHKVTDWKDCVHTDGELPISVSISFKDRSMFPKSTVLVFKSDRSDTGPVLLLFGWYKDTLSFFLKKGDEYKSLGPTSDESIFLLPTAYFAGYSACRVYSWNDDIVPGVESIHTIPSMPGHEAQNFYILANGKTLDELI
jgi:hypothetical protein